MYWQAHLEKFDDDDDDDDDDDVSDSADFSKAEEYAQGVTMNIVYGVIVAVIICSIFLVVLLMTYCYYKNNPQGRKRRSQQKTSKLGTSPQPQNYLTLQPKST